MSGSDTMAAMDLSTTLLELDRLRDKVTRYQSHVTFLNSCLEHKVIPTGMLLKFGKDAMPNLQSLHHSVEDIICCANQDILHQIKSAYTVLLAQERDKMDTTLYNLYHSTDYFLSEKIILHHHRKLKTAQDRLKKKKRRKLMKLLHEDTHSIQTAVEVKKKGRNRRFKRISTNISENARAASQPKGVVINLSSLELTADQEELLSLGPKYCPTPNSLDRDQLTRDIEEGCRKLRLKEMFYESDEEEETTVPKFYKATGYSPPTGRDSALDQYCKTLINRAEQYLPSRRPHDNLSHGLRKALKDLRDLVTNRKLRISCADKGGAVVVQNTSDYIAEALRQLNNEEHYETLKKDPTVSIAHKSNQIANKLLRDGYIDETTHRWAIVEPIQTRCHEFYMLPKIHKTLENPPGRPIVSGVNGPTENLSRLVDDWLQDHVHSLPSYIQDTTDMLSTLQLWNMKFGPFGENTRLVTIDVVGLYSNIPHEDMNTAVKSMVSKQGLENGLPVDQLLSVMNHVLSSNVFCFDDKFYRQKMGTAMGTPMAPSVACLFMGWLEQQLLSNSPVPILTELWKRFIDDIFMLWTGTEEELLQFFEFINGYHTTIKFTMNHSTDSVSFLDVLISLKNGYLQTDLFSKPTDTHAYLHSTSCHPRHMVKNIPYAQFLRLRRLCSDSNIFHSRCEEMEQNFIKRGYKREVLTEARAKASRIPRHQTLAYKQREKKQSRVPIVVTHNPANPPLRTWFRELHPLLQVSQRMSKASPSPPILAERKCHSLRTLLMPSPLPIPNDDDAGCFRCMADRCVLCRDHVVQARTFASHTTGETFTIRHKLSCNSSNIVYLLYCDACHQSQYVGETKLTLKERFYQHRSNIHLNKGFCTFVNHHFNQEQHSLQDMRCIAVERVHVRTKAARHKREQFWIRKLRTVYPCGLNAMVPGQHD